MRYCLLIPAVLLCACAPSLVPLPPQQAAAQAEDPPDERFLVRMVVPSADKRIVQEIGGTAAMFRWTAGEPAVRVKLPDAGPWLARMEFAIAEATWKETGPVTVTLLLNGRTLGVSRYERFGEHEFAVPVPAGALPGGGEARLSARIDPVWVAPSDGAKLGVLLKAMGFARP